MLFCGLATLTGVSTMIRNVLIAGIMFALSGSVYAIEQAKPAEEAKEGPTAQEVIDARFQAQCTEWGTENGLQAEQLESYVSECIKDMSAINPTGTEES
jgi:fructose-specific phosphotransferase system IIC component